VVVPVEPPVAVMAPAPASGSASTGGTADAGRPMGADAQAVNEPAGDDDLLVDQAADPAAAAAAMDTSTKDGAQAARLIERARDNLLASPKLAYRDAKAAYDLRATQTALQLMGHAACRMGSDDKADYAYRRLRGKPQRALASSCLQLGIELE
jgi:hypothetical protein